MNNNKRPLKLVLHGMSNRFVKTMMQFLLGPCDGAAVIVTDTEDADVNVDVFDVDAELSKKLLDAHLKQQTSRPIIVLSVQSLQHEGVLNLKKPINAPEMQQVLAEAKKIISTFLAKPQEHPFSIRIDAQENEIADLVKNVLNDDDFDNLFKDDFFEYLKRSSWDDGPQTKGVAEKLVRQAPIPEPLDTAPASHEARQISQAGGVAQPDSGTPTQREPDNTPSDLTDSTDAETTAPGSHTADTTNSPQPAQLEKPEEDDPAWLKTFSADVERKKTAKHTTANRLDEENYKDFFSIVDDIETTYRQKFIDARYNPNDYFQGFFLDACMFPIAIFPQSHEVWLNANDFELNTLAVTTIRYKTSSTEIPMAPIDNNTINTHFALDKFQNMDAFLWKLACWTSKGCYPQAIDFNKPVFLKNWPNFTRLLITPHAMRIAALLIRGPRTMMNIAKMLDIKPQYVFMFVSAAHASNLVGQAVRLADSAVQPLEIKPRKTQGLLAKIINKLRK
jgi:hypothetical protein